MTKGNNRKPNDSFQQFVLDQLAGLNSVNCRTMFGGFGLYQNGIFFGIIHKGRLYFKTNESTRSLFIEQGMKPFRPNGTQTLKNYYEVPAEVIDDPNDFIAWAKDAVTCGSS